MTPKDFKGFDTWYIVNRRMFSTKENAYHYYLIEYVTKEEKIFQHETLARQCS